MPETLRLPLLGKVRTANLSLPALTALLAAADGFNPRAMWVLGGVFMLDDLVVLVAALKTLEVSGLTTRYARWSNAVGGLSLVGVGALLVFRPEWLAFG